MLAQSAPSRIRIGYAFDRFLPYVTGGVAFGYSLRKKTGADGKSLGSSIEIQEEQAKIVRRLTLSFRLLKSFYRVPYGDGFVRFRSAN